MFSLYIDSYNSVSFELEYDYEITNRQIRSQHLSRAGRKYIYKWGDIRGRAFSVRYVNSATTSIINSWWRTNVSLKFQEEGSTYVFSCHLSNEQMPIGSFEKPYNELYRGTIELEGY